MPSEPIPLAMQSIILEVWLNAAQLAQRDSRAASISVLNVFAMFVQNSSF